MWIVKMGKSLWLFSSWIQYLNLMTLLDLSTVLNDSSSSVCICNILYVQYSWYGKYIEPISYAPCSVCFIVFTSTLNLTHHCLD